MMFFIIFPPLHLQAATQISATPPSHTHLSTAANGLRVSSLQFSSVSSVYLANNKLRTAPVNNTSKTRSRMSSNKSVVGTPGIRQTPRKQNRPEDFMLRCLAPAPQCPGQYNTSETQLANKSKGGTSQGQTRFWADTRTHIRSNKQGANTTGRNKRVDDRRELSMQTHTNLPISISR